MAIICSKDAHIQFVDLANRLLELFFGELYQEPLLFEVVVNLHQNVVYFLYFGCLFLLLAIPTVDRLLFESSIAAITEGWLHFVGSSWYSLE